MLYLIILNFSNLFIAILLPPSLLMPLYYYQQSNLNLSPLRLTELELLHTTLLLRIKSLTEKKQLKQRLKLLNKLLKTKQTTLPLPVLLETLNLEYTPRFQDSLLKTYLGKTHQVQAHSPFQEI